MNKSIKASLLCSSLIPLVEVFLLQFPPEILLASKTRAMLLSLCSIAALRQPDSLESLTFCLVHHKAVKYFIQTPLLPAHSARLHPKLHLQSHCSLSSPLRRRESLLSFSSIIRLTRALPPCEQLSGTVLTPLCFSLYA